MGNELRFDEKVVIVTGAGNGLGRCHALLFASRGARVVVNDLGGDAFGGGKGSAAADQVVAEIVEAGGEAVANYDSVEDGGKIVQTAMDTWGRIDVVVNNAGILRDTSFHKMSESDWDLINRVHVLGAFRVTHAAWPHMREQQYGRVVMTASAAGIYGNFGQANYSTAKLGVAGFGYTLALEGRKRNIHVNTIAPIAGSRMTATVLPPDLLDALQPEYVSPLVAWLAHEECKETGGLFEVGGGFMAKLRWERTAGKTWRLGRKVTPDSVAAEWEAITSFDEGAVHPANINESIQSIMANVQAGPSLGANKFIDVDKALGWEFPEDKTSWDERDLSLYALGVGAATDPLDQKELQLVYEMHGKGFRPLPTYGVVPAVNVVLEMAKRGVKVPGLDYGLDRILHGEQYTEIKRPLPKKATLTHRAKVSEIWDKGRHAVVVTEVDSFDEAGDLLLTNRISMLVRGAGGWGGERGPSTEKNVPPDRAPDATVSETVPANQALLYRLAGDWNPLHVNPNMARAFGFERPILHGLCTFGYIGRHVLGAMCDGDTRYFKSINVRFASTVFPGETLVTEMWRESDTRVVFRCTVKERGVVAISNAAIELYTEIPKKKEKPKKKAAAAQAAAPVSAEPISADIFTALEGYVGSNPDVAAKVGVVFQWRLTSPDSAWVMDLTGAGAVKAGETSNAECTLELTDADFMAMVSGKADAQKLYFGGKLKISGNVMASQKLEFLSKLDPKLVMDAAKARVASGGAAPPDAAGAAGAAAPAASPSGDIFVAIADHVKRHPDLVTRIGKLFQFKLAEPDSVWTIDLKNGEGAVVAGDGGVKPDCTLAMTDTDFIGMAKGELDAQKLFFGGQMKITGDVMASQKLEFLQEIDPEQAKAAVAAARASGGGPAAAAPAAPAEKREALAPQIFANLTKRLAENPGLAAEVGVVVQFAISDPDAAWVVDMSGDGAVREGADDGAAATLRLAEEDLVALVRGEADAQDLFQRGRLAVEGDIGVAHRLGFLNALV